MADRLGARQLEVLEAVASPRFLLLTPCRRARDLVQRGLLAEDRGAVWITPAGLRALADAMEAGRVLPAGSRPFAALKGEGHA